MIDNPTICVKCRHSGGPLDLSDPPLCYATAKQDGVDYVSGVPTYKGEVYCRDRNKGRCRWFKAIPPPPSPPASVPL